MGTLGDDLVEALEDAVARLDGDAWRSASRAADPPEDGEGYGIALRGLGYQYRD